MAPPTQPPKFQGECCSGFVVVVVVVVVGGGGGGNDGGRSVDHQDAKRKQRQGIGCGCALAHMTVCQNLEANKLYSSLGVVG